MKKLVILLLVASALLAGDLQNYIGKTETQLSGFSAGKTNIGQVAWWNTQVFAPMRQLIQRTNQYRHSRDYTSIQAAVDSGGVVTIDPQDTVTVTASVDIGSYQALSGSGPTSVLTSTKLSYVVGMPVVSVDHDSFVVIAGIHFRPDSSDTYLIEHDHCISLKGAKYVLITDCIFEAVGDGICLEHDSDDGTKNEHIVIANCIFRGGYYSADNWAYPCSRNGVSIVDGHYVTITGCSFEGFNGPGCIDMEPNSGAINSVTNVSVTGCTFNNLKHGILMVSGAEENIIEGVSIVGNTFAGTNYDGQTMTGSAIWMESYVRNVTVTGNTITNQTYGSYPGIFVRAVRENVVISGNDIGHCALHGIQLMSCPNGVTVVGNSIHHCGSDGIYAYGDYSDYTSSALTQPGMESTGGWTSYGTPTTQVRSSTYAYAGTYSRQLTTDADGEGIYQVLNFAPADTSYWFLVKARVYVTDDSYSAYAGKVQISVTGGREFHEIAYASECSYDSTWVEVACYFRPNATAPTLYITSSESMTWYVDDVKVYKWAAQAGVVITDNRCYNNITAGIRADLLFNSIVNDNLCYNAQIAVDDTASQDYGIKLSNCIDTDILGNRLYNSDAFDLYLTDIYDSQLSSLGASTTYGSDLKWCSFPYAKLITFYSDSVSEAGTWQQVVGTDSVQQMYMAPCNGRIVGISGCFTKQPVKSAGFRVYPVFGDSVRYDVHYGGGSNYLILNGTNRAAVLNFLDYRLSFQRGEMLTVLMEGNASVDFGGLKVGIYVTLLFE